MERPEASAARWGRCGSASDGGGRVVRARSASFLTWGRPSGCARRAGSSTFQSLALFQVGVSGVGIGPRASKLGSARGAALRLAEADALGELFLHFLRFGFFRFAAGFLFPLGTVGDEARLRLGHRSTGGGKSWPGWAGMRSSTGSAFCAGGCRRGRGGSGSGAGKAGAGAPPTRPARAPQWAGPPVPARGQAPPGRERRGCRRKRRVAANGGLSSGKRKAHHRPKFPFEKPRLLADAVSLLMPSLSPASVASSLAGLAPVEVAAQLRHLPDLVFFDSAREPAGLSIVAARPELVIRGEMAADWLRFAAELRSRTEVHADDGRPRGFAAGYVAYDGQFHFGFYARKPSFSITLPRRGLKLGALYRVSSAGPLLLRLRSLARRSAPTPTRAAFCARRRARAGIHRRRRHLSGEPRAPIFRGVAGRSLRFTKARCRNSPAPHAAFLCRRAKRCSPPRRSCFCECPARRIRTRPIKGTRPRSAIPHADEKSAYELHHLRQRKSPNSS